MLEHAWRAQKLSYTIVLLTPVAYSTLEFAKSQLEWMNEDISEAFNKARTNPFEFRYFMRELQDCGHYTTVSLPTPTMQ